MSTSPVNRYNRISNTFTVGGLQIPISTPRVDCTLIGQQEPPSTSPIDGNNIVGGQPLSPTNPPADIHTIFSRNTRVRESTDSDSTSCESVTGNTENSQIGRLIEAINRNQQIPADTTGACVPPNASQQQSFQAQIETLTKKLSELSPSTTKSNKIAAYSKP